MLDENQIQMAIYLVIVISEANLMVCNFLLLIAVVGAGFRFVVNYLNGGSA